MGISLYWGRLCCESEFDYRFRGSARVGCDYLGECIPGKNMLQTAKKTVLQEGSQPRRESEEMKSER